MADGDEETMKMQKFGSIEGYLKSLPKAQVLNSTAATLMKSAPNSLSKNIKTWNVTASKVRVGIRRDEPQTLPPTDPAFQSPIAKRLYNALAKEWNLIQAEAREELNKAWPSTTNL